MPETVAGRRNAGRADRDVGMPVVRRQQRDLSRSKKRLRKEGFRQVHVLDAGGAPPRVQIVRERPWNDRSEVHGPFDVIGDVHGCLGELRTLLEDPLFLGAAA